MKNIYFIIISLILILYIVNNVRKGNFSIKESFFWMVGCVCMLILSIFPKSIDYFANKLGVSYPPSLLFVLCIIFLVFINFKNSKRISEQQSKIITLAQEVSILKNKLK